MLHQKDFSRLASHTNSSPTAVKTVNNILGHQLPLGVSTSFHFLEWRELTSATAVGQWSTFAGPNASVFPWTQRPGESISSKPIVLTSTKQPRPPSHKRTEEYCFLKKHFHVSLYSNFGYAAKERNRNWQMISKKIINKL